MWFLYIKSGTELPDFDDGCPYDFTKLEAARWFKNQNPSLLQEFTIKDIANLLEDGE